MGWQATHIQKARGLAAAGLVLAGVLSGCGGPAGPAGFLILATDAPPSATVTPIPPTATLTPTLEPTATVPPPTSTPPEPTPAPSATATAAPSPTAGPTPDQDAPFRWVELPILMYHYVEPWPSGADEVRMGLTVRPEDFAAQLAYLRAEGYQAVSLYDLVAALAAGQPLPEKPVVLTFDDGYRTLMDYAVPVMEQYGYTGTVFVITQLMDEGFPQYLTWEQAESLHARGWMIEPHTKTHDQLEGRGRDFQLYQMLGSLQTVEAHIGRTPRFFAYPSGKYDALSVELAKELHLWGAVTTGFGRLHNYHELHTLARVRVSGTASLEEFVAALGNAP